MAAVPLSEPSLHSIERALEEDRRGERHWKRWGTYLPDRQWATIREDYSEDVSSWAYFPHDHARSRAYRWGEDGLFGWTDDQARLCFSFAFWNGKDPILKERLFGLGPREGNHGADVKECYYFLENTPIHSYCSVLYKYPHARFPYEQLLEENRRRGPGQPEFELEDTGVFEGNRYFDILIEYAKGEPDDTLIRVTATNQGPEPATLHLLPMVWFRNTWSWGRQGNGYWPKPTVSLYNPDTFLCQHESLGRFYFFASNLYQSRVLFTENETNCKRLYGEANASPYVKDAFHEAVVHGRSDACNPNRTGTKAARHYRLRVLPGMSLTLHFRLYSEANSRLASLGYDFEELFGLRKYECDDFYQGRPNAALEPGEAALARRAYASALWAKQYYQFHVREWMDGDPAMPRPPHVRDAIHGRGWPELCQGGIAAVADRWEYPFQVSSDGALGLLSLLAADPAFVQGQVLRFFREGAVQADGRLAASEADFSEAHPPVEAWLAWNAYRLAPREHRDRDFLKHCQEKLGLYLAWWLSRKDAAGRGLLDDGFLGAGAIDRAPLAPDLRFEQAGALMWAAFFAAQMVAIALELAVEDETQGEEAAKSFGLFCRIVEGVEAFRGVGLWDEADGFYYDCLRAGDASFPVRARSAFGLVPVLAAGAFRHSDPLRSAAVGRLWESWAQSRPGLDSLLTFAHRVDEFGVHRRLLAMPTPGRLRRILARLLDEAEFLSPHGIRSLSKFHETHAVPVPGAGLGIRYEPGAAAVSGRPNWRGPVWFSLNYLLVDALSQYHDYYGDAFRAECPTGSGNVMTLGEVAEHLAGRLAGLFLPGPNESRPYAGGQPSFPYDSAGQPLYLFHECFHGDTGRGLGASHMTGATALVERCLDLIGRSRGGQSSLPPGG